ncbi:MAG: hypothetical protein M3020_16750 [Myxococcota bacterium]|nr:hypothetical protein [Myxococcota bacterium]
MLAAQVRSFSLVALLALSAVGCGSKGAVSLFARVDNPELSVRSNALTEVLNGSFDLVLELGDHAEESTTVKWGSVSILGASGPIVDRVDAPPDVEFPLVLGAGDSVTAHCTLTEDQLIDSSEDLCAGPVRLSVMLSDSLNSGRPTETTSHEFNVTCE